MILVRSIEGGGLVATSDQLAYVYGVPPKHVLLSVVGGSMLLNVALIANDFAHLQVINSTVTAVSDSDLSTSLGVNCTRVSDVSKAVRMVNASVSRLVACGRGFWCSSGIAIACPRGYYNPTGAILPPFGRRKGFKSRAHATMHRITFLQRTGTIRATAMHALPFHPTVSVPVYE